LPDGVPDPAYAEQGFAGRPSQAERAGGGGRGREQPADRRRGADRERAEHAASLLRRAGAAVADLARSHRVALGRRGAQPSLAEGGRPRAAGEGHVEYRSWRRLRRSTSRRPSISRKSTTRSTRPARKSASATTSRARKRTSS